MVRVAVTGARIVNMSLQWIDTNACSNRSSDDPMPLIDEQRVLMLREWTVGTNRILGAAVEEVRARGLDVLWVFAAGNGCRHAALASPGSLALVFPEDTVTVGAIGATGQIAPYTNGGLGVEIAAPGSEVFSTFPQECVTEGAWCVDRYGFRSGTSMAAAHVSGVAVLARSAHPGLPASEVKRCIVGTRTEMWVVDAAAAVACAEGLMRRVRDHMRARPSVHMHASVDVDRLTGDQGRIWGAEPGDDATYVVVGSDTTQGDPGG